MLLLVLAFLIGLHFVMFVFLPELVRTGGIFIPICADAIAFGFDCGSISSFSYIAKILLIGCVKAARLFQTSYLKDLAYYIFFGQKRR